MKNDGGPAFPRGGGKKHIPGDYETRSVTEIWPPREGMSVRTWLAGMFAAAIFANPAREKMNVDDVALKAHAAADAMLAEGEKNDDT